MSDEVRRRLEAAGDRPAPAPRPSFAADLEERLLSLAAGAPPSKPPPPIRRRSTLLRPVLAIAAAVVVLVVTSFGIGLQQPAYAFELSAASGVEVELADGTTLVDPDGLLLPDGAIVRVGAGGSARIGDVELDAGDVARVVDRRLRIDRAVALASGSPSRSPVTPGTPVPSRAPSPAPVEPSRAPSSAPSAAPASPKPVTSPDAPGTVVPVRPSPSAATARPGPTATPSTVTDIRRIKLSARAVAPAQVGVLWSGIDGARRYVLLASAAFEGSADDPVYGRARVFGEFTRPPATPLTFRVGDRVVELRLLVVALDGEGTVIARSNVATVTWPD